MPIQSAYTASCTAIGGARKILASNPPSVTMLASLSQLDLLSESNVKYEPPNQPKITVVGIVE